jgi:Ala-tRNA(Pro) deacylase
MPPDVLDTIRKLYNERRVPYRELAHEPTRTSEESARVRGEPLEVGGKALLLKCDDRFCLIVLPAHCRLDSARARQLLQAKKMRFATANELQELTGLEPGSVPPFGRPILPFELYADQSLRANDRIAFNAGSLTVSHVLAMDDYVALAQPRWVDVVAAVE